MTVDLFNVLEALIGSLVVAIVLLGVVLVIIAGPTDTNQDRVIKEVNENNVKILEIVDRANKIGSKGIPPPPKPPLSRVINDSLSGTCGKCNSSTIKRFFIFGKSIGCIQDECTNYYKNR
jgi:hypothetical protein